MNLAAGELLSRAHCCSIRLRSEEELDFIDEKFIDGKMDFCAADCEETVHTIGFKLTGDDLGYMFC